MVVKQFPPAITKPKPPQLHTHKNHDTYNGLLHLPHTTHVRISDHVDPRLQTTTTTSSPGVTCTTYIITLQYRHNRACEIVRSHADVCKLRQQLDLNPCLDQNLATTRGQEAKPDACVNVGGRRKGGGDDDIGGETSTDRSGRSECDGSSSKWQQTDPARAGTCSSSMVRASCHRACACACSCGLALGPDALAARELGELLEGTLERLRKGYDGDGVRIVVEWFLRRRAGDCGGR